MLRTVHEHDGLKVIQLRDQPSTHLIGDQISLTIYELQQPGCWIVGCSVARFEDYEFTAKPHDVDDALRVAINLISDRLVWLMRQCRRELTVMRKAVETDGKVDQPASAELGSKE